MDEVQIERVGVNVAQLETELRAKLGADVLGVSAGPYGVRVHLRGAPNARARAQQAQAVRAAVLAHRPQPSAGTPSTPIAALRGRAWSTLSAAEKDAAWALVFGKLFGEGRGV